MLKKLKKNRWGFTLIELMIVITIIGILASIAVPNYRWGLIKAREAVLKEDLYHIRRALDQYFADNGKYPDSLDELTNPSKQYLYAIPADVFTGQKDWVTKAPDPPAEGQPEIKGNVQDVHSNSDLVGSDGKPYKDW